MNIQRSHRRFAAAIFILLALVSIRPGAVYAQTGAGVQMSVQSGFGGYCRTSSWIPVRVTLENNGADVSGQIEVEQLPPGGNRQLFTREVSLGSQARKTLDVSFYPDGYFDSLKVTLSSGGNAISSRTVKLNCLDPGDRLTGVVAPSLTPFNAIQNVQPADGRSYIAQLQMADLPEDAALLASLDTLIFSGADTSSLSIAQRTALSTWVAGGGQLVITSGAGWQAGLADLAPVQPQGSRDLDGLDALAGWSGAGDSLVGKTVIGLGSLKPGAAALVQQGDVPLVANASRGLGKVIYLAFDPALAPFSAWSGREDFFRRLLEPLPARPRWSWGFQDWSSAAAVVSSLPNMALPKTGEVVGFLLLYVAVVGPLNYLLLRRLKRSSLAWLTIPVIVVAFSLLAFLAGSSSRGNSPVLSRVALVQVEPGEKVSQVDALVGVYSPNRTSYTLQIGPGYQVRPLVDNSNSGNSGIQSPSEWRFVQSPGSGTTLPDIHVDIGGIQAVILQGQASAPDIQSDLALQLTSSGTSLVGYVTNNSALTLEDAALITPTGASALGTLAPGSRKEVNASLPLQGGASYAMSNRPGSAAWNNPLPSNSTLMTDVIGSVDYYQNKTLFRRFQLLSALVNGYQLSNDGTLGQVYLTGWVNGSPVESSLVGRSAAATDLSLYMVRLNSRIELQGSPVELGPEMFRWWTVDQDSTLTNASPYSFSPGQGSYTLAFQTLPGVSYRKVDGLTLSLLSQKSSGQVQMAISLWDWSERVWVDQAISSDGRYPIESPQRFLSPEGEIRLHVESGSPTSYVYIDHMDFWMQVEP
jgi:hypothetical protein